MEAEQILRIVNALGSLLTGGAVGVLSFLFFFDSRKRTEAAKAKQSEAEARKLEEENITSYAAEWKELYEKKEHKVAELEAKAEEDRKRIRELTEKNMQLSLDLQKSEFKKCEVKGCDKRQPPTGY